MKPNLDEEKLLWKRGFKFVVGLDEAGRGPLAGPVVAGAVVLPKNFSNKNFWAVKDSKQLSEKQREKIYEILIKNKNIKWGIGIVSEKIIDKINILEATKLAMGKAIKNLKVDYLLLDGNFKIDASRLRQGFGEPKQKSIIKGDQKIFSISAASILAKVTRDKIMDKYHKKYPQYNFAKHKGYPTKEHRELLLKYGSCEIHRKTFNFVN